MKKRTVEKLKANQKRRRGTLKNTSFPLKPLTVKDAHCIISIHCKTVSPRSFKEAGCAVCGMLKPITELLPLENYRGSLALLIRPGVIRKERFKSTDPIEDLIGPVLAEGCSHVCVDLKNLKCSTSDLNNGILPKTALAHHKWIASIPETLRDLTYAEGIMIARV
ncbi:hypothetical protein B0H19DRAFT_962175 [Mycena capillaripes]|nr:hypothetical protein B0H19DRAFT_962175 [Mycena capillaripes]